MIIFKNSIHVHNFWRIFRFLRNYLINCWLMYLRASNSPLFQTNYFILFITLFPHHLLSKANKENRLKHICYWTSGAALKTFYSFLSQPIRSINRDNRARNALKTINVFWGKLLTFGKWKEMRRASHKFFWMQKKADIRLGIRDQNLVAWLQKLGSSYSYHDFKFGLPFYR